MNQRAKHLSKNLLCLILALACLTFLTGCATQKSSSKAALEVVIPQVKQAELEFMNSVSQAEQDPAHNILNSKLSDALQRYADNLVAIDISQCPEDFRLAFVRYYQAVQNLKTYADSCTGWRGLLKGILNPATIIGVADNNDDTMKPLQEAGNDLELVCTKYGVEMK